MKPVTCNLSPVLRNSVDRPGKAGYFPGSRFFVKHFFFGGFVNYGLCNIQLFAGCFNRGFAHGKLYLFDNTFDSAFDRFIPHPVDFVLPGAFQFGFMICQLSELLLVTGYWVLGAGYSGNHHPAPRTQRSFSLSFSIYIELKAVSQVSFYFAAALPFYEPAFLYALPVSL